VLVQRCRTEIGQVLKLPPDRVDPAAPLASLGLDSLMGLELRKRLETAVEASLPATLAWRYPTVDALAPFLAECMGITLDAAGPRSTAPAVPVARPAVTEPAEPAEPALDLEALSDSDVEALLLERLDVIAPVGHGVTDERA